ncbi:unnamed protein product [Rotaria socialis]|uniref:Uncharacterized protein n=1 Tax=Rotaria socialis TaxID=392032 RepID=A0A821CTX2_9BILA|nr:unnamed protein product [Rotaria socialis]
MMSDEMLLENNLQPHRRAVLEYEFGEPSSFSYLIGNTKPVYIGITSYTVSPVRYLFLGSGDLRNILDLVRTSSTVHEWDFTLSTSIFALLHVVCESIAAILSDKDAAVVARAQNEIRCYMKDGTTGMEKDHYSVNITMLQATSGIYIGHHSVHPYLRYLPFGNVKEQQEFQKISNQVNYPLLTYSQHKLRQWMENYCQN